ncbi:MAG: GH1 family beta-glucosidase [Anaerolineales bacterium]|nr:GH1 family beta-glucosidase [Anaerolineales bacterium]
MSSDFPRFPSGFAWGAATAAYQIEGAAQTDGRGESIWDRFCRTPGRVLDGDTGDVACDHYHRYRDDIALMQSLGLNAYRFSIAWPRILPQGRGAVNPAGLDFYDRLVDSLLAANSTPFVTLYHWDLPQALQDEGGWADRAIVDAFAHYANVVSRRLGDRVHHWITHNEPWCVSFLGHYTGEHAPGRRDLRETLQVAHNVLLSHGAAVPILRANARPEHSRKGGTRTRVGITCNLTPGVPASDSESDMAAARRWDGYFNRWFLDPLAGRGYPEDMLAYYGPAVPTIQPGDLDRIAVPLDFFGLNYYFRAVVSDDPAAPVPQAHQHRVEGADYTVMDWEIYPDGLCELLLRLSREYRFPAIYVTENGAAFADGADSEGVVHDARRVAFLQAHIAAVHQALAAGTPLAGYFVWSLLDNFEWAYGYAKRFGIVYVDYPTQRRIIKDSGRWYAALINAQRARPL